MPTEFGASCGKLSFIYPKKLFIFLPFLQTFKIDSIKCKFVLKCFCKCRIYHNLFHSPYIPVYTGFPPLFSRLMENKPYTGDETCENCSSTGVGFHHATFRPTLFFSCEASTTYKSLGGVFSVIFTVYGRLPMSGSRPRC